MHALITLPLSRSLALSLSLTFSNMHIGCTRANPRKPARTNPRTHSRTHSQTHARPHTHARTHARTHSSTHTHARMHTYSHARTHVRTHDIPGGFHFLTFNLNSCKEDAFFKTSGIMSHVSCALKNYTVSVPSCTDISHLVVTSTTFKCIIFNVSAPKFFLNL